MAQQIQIDILIQKAQASQSLTDFRKNLKELQVALSQATDPKDILRLQKAIASTTKNAEDFRDRLNTIKLDTFEQGAKIGQLVAGGFAAATSAAALFGAESENVEKALLRVQAAIGLLQGLQSLQELPRVFGDLTDAIGLTNGSLRITRTLLVSLGIGALVAGVALLVTYWEDIKQLVNDTTPSIEEQTALIESTLETLTLQQGIVEAQITNYELQNKETIDLEKRLISILELQAEQLRIQLLQNRTARDRRIEEQKSLTFWEQTLLKAAGLLGVWGQSRFFISKIREDKEEIKKLDDESLRLEKELLGIQNNIATITNKRNDKNKKSQQDAAEKERKANEEALKILDELNKEVGILGDNKIKQVDNYIKQIQKENNVIENRYKLEEDRVNIDFNEKIRLLDTEFLLRLEKGEDFEKLEKERSDRLEKLELDRSLVLTNIAIDRNNALIKVYEKNVKNVGAVIGKSFTDFQREAGDAYEKALKDNQKFSKLSEKEISDRVTQYKELLKLAFDEFKELNDTNKEDFIKSTNEETLNLDNNLTKRLQLIIQYFTRKNKKEKEATQQQKIEEDKRLANLQQKLQISSQIVGDVGQIFNNNLDIQLNELTSSLDQRSQEIQSFYDEQLNRQDLTERKRVSIEKKRDEELAKLDEERRRKEKEINNRRASGQLTSDLANITFQVASQILQNPALTAFYIGAGAIASAAAISRFQAEKSREFGDGGLLTGPLHSQGGIPVGNTGISVEGEEYIVNRRATANFLPLLETINANGGNGMNSDFMSEIRGINSRLETLINSPARAYVVESELTAVQNRVQQLERKIKIS